MRRRYILSLVLALGAWAFCNRAFTAAPDAAFSVAAVLTHKQAFDRPHDIELQGDLAFVPGKGGSMAIVDVADPAKPKLLWHRHDGKALADAETVLPLDGRLLLGTHNLISVDVRDPKQPVFSTDIHSSPRISHINGMARRGDTIFAAGKNGVLAAFDVSKPATPAAAGALNVRKQYDIGWPHDVDLLENYAVVPDPRQFGRVKEEGKLALFQVFDERGKLLDSDQWKMAGVVATEALVGANRVQVVGRRAYVGASTRGEGGRLIVVDLSKPASPRQVAVVPFAPNDRWGPNGLTVAGQIVFLAGGQSVEAIDISRPRHPVKLASQSFAEVLQNANPRYAGGGDSAHDIVYRNGHLYVTGQNDHCLMILRVESERIRELADLDS